MQSIIFIAVGGALGALSRYGLGLWISNKWNQGFPLHTFLINITGAFLLGFLNILFVETQVWRQIFPNPVIPRVSCPIINSVVPNN